ncbi:hypothetical protein LCGC14_0531560 [marine sediment metagenome]|uniref:Uncharacterized protein n=1 Tax=marine sediment metagenome TaxID=412755 RepID=A0A0F9RVM6_9ZZZZ
MPKKNISFEELLGITKDPMIKVAIKRLRPPREVETSVVEAKDGNQLSATISHVDTDSKTSEMELDFSYLTNNSSFQRAITEFFKKFAVGFEKIKVRGTKKQIQDSFSQNKRALLLELKEVLKKRNDNNSLEIN